MIHHHAPIDLQPPASPRHLATLQSAAGPLTGTKTANGVWQRIISEMPPHRVYIEPFWGRGSIAARKRPAELTIGCDLDPDAIASGAGRALMFRVDALEFLRGYFRPFVDATPHHASAAAVATFGGYLYEEHFVYLDPPYLDVRNYYHDCLSEEDHRELCRLFCALPCPAALSGYHSEAYAAELHGVRFIEIPTVNRGGKACVEVLWCNYPPPVLLHDARFIGDSRRGRERIRRRVRNWRRNFRGMSSVEKQAVIEELQSELADAVCRGDSSTPRKNRKG